MTDDWSSPTGEYELRQPADVQRFADDIEPDFDALAPELGVTSGELRIVDAFFYHLALDAAEDPRPPTAEEQLAIDYLRERFERLKAMTPEQVEAERQRLIREGW